MLQLLKNNFFLFFILISSFESYSEEDPFNFIDKNAQEMVEILTNESYLFESNRS